jgi:O-antigen/teichoic acid export membrane protein
MIKNKRFGILLILNLVIKFIAIICSLALNRWLNQLQPDLFADINSILPFLSLLIAGMINMGIPILIQREYTKHLAVKSSNIGSYIINLQYLQFAVFLLGFPLIFAFYRFFFQESILPLIFLIYGAQYILTIDLNFRSISDALGKTWKFSLTDLVGKILQITFLFGSILIFNKDQSINLYIISAYLAAISSFGLDFYISKKNIPIGKFNFNLLKQQSKSIIYLSISALVVSSYMVTDKLFLRGFGVDYFSFNGYSNIYRIFETTMIAPGVVLPSLVSFYFKGEKNSSRILKTFVFVILFSFICALVYFILSPIILQLIDPQNKYTEYSLLVLPMLSVSLFLFSLGSFMSQINIFLGGEKYELIVTIILASTTLTLYWFLISKYGIVGAAISTLISFCLDVLLKIVLFVYLQRKSLNSYHNEKENHIPIN